MASPTAEDVLAVWFGPLDEDGLCRAEEHAARWWRKDPGFDRELEERFGSLHARMAAGADPFDESPHGRLATVIVLDQLSRNLHRHDAKAFAQDERAQGITRAGIQQGHDERLRGVERAFFYMPLVHSEALTDHVVAGERLQALVDGASPRAKKTLEGFASSAAQHRALIERFGRYPHRNVALSRTSTPEEIAFLAAGGTSF
ncbi:MAG: DUF924 family protein [Sandaracinaceae bacterium]